MWLRSATILFLVVATSVFAKAECPVDEVVVKGRIEHPPSNANVLVQLVFAKNTNRDSSDITPETNKFRVPLTFFTQSRKPIVEGTFGKCGRKPFTIIVILRDRERNREYDRITLDFKKDFKMVDSTTYLIKSDVVLKGPQQ
jgi:hypothetical protein